MCLLPTEQGVVGPMSDDPGCPPSYRALLIGFQAVFAELHSVAVAVTVGWQMTLCFHGG